MKQHGFVIWIWHSSFKTNGSYQDPKPNVTRDFIDRAFMNSSYVIVRHSLYRGGKTIVTTHMADGREIKTEYAWVGRLPDGVRYCAEFLFNLHLFVRLGRVERVFAIDPLSAIVPVFLKLFRLIKTIYFFTPDFARRRFSNPILNSFYFLLDGVCTRVCDINICNSSHVIEYKKQLYGKLVDAKFFHLPNVPSPSVVQNYVDIQKKKHQIIHVSNLTDEPLKNFEALFDAVEEVAKIIPDISLIIVGDGPDRQRLETMARGRAVFTGMLSRNETLSKIAESEIGLALYDGSNSYDEFRDSLKIREYQALGVVPVTTGVVVSNTLDIREAKSGLIIEQCTTDALSEGLLSVMLGDVGQYKQNGYNITERAQKAYANFERLILHELD